ncbi:MAG: hypothetical protein M1838_003907 [Thelocarpon superellum]|nr:MAG: hypothetical protein M1838_003907 [Thelocarpon superellum]
MVRGPWRPLDATEASALRSPRLAPDVDRPSLPKDAPAVLHDATISVTDPERILSLHRTARQRQFNDLVRRYIAQLTYGCQEPSCTTPTCWSTRKRAAREPVRRFTATSARTLACYLASQDDPEKALCRQKRLVAPSTPASLQQVQDVLPNGKALGRSKASSIDGRSERSSYQSTFKSLPTRPPKSDPKSFTQNLFNSSSLQTLGRTARVTPGHPVARADQSHGSEGHKLRSHVASAELGREPTEDEAPLLAARPRGPYHPDAESIRRTIHSIRTQRRRRETWDGVTVGSRPRDLGTHLDVTPPITIDRTTSAAELDEEAVKAPSLSHLSVGLVATWMRMSPRNECPGDNAPYSIFMDQSTFYALSHPVGLLQSFRTHQPPASQLSTDLRGLNDALRWLLDRDRDLVLQSLWLGIKALFVPPSELAPPRGPKARVLILASLDGRDAAAGMDPSSGDNRQPDYLQDDHFCHVVAICLHALAAMMPIVSPDVRLATQRLRAVGTAGLDAFDDTRVVHDTAKVTKKINAMMRCLDTLEDELPLRLVSRLMRGIAARLYYDQACRDRARKYVPGPESSTGRHGDLATTFGRVLLDLDLDRPVDAQVSGTTEPDDGVESTPRRSGWSNAAIIVEWIRTVILKEWDGSMELSRFSVAGSAVTVLGHLYEVRNHLGLPPESFQMSCMSDGLDHVDIPEDWPVGDDQRKSIHLLSYPFLFRPSTLITLFRAINFAKMSRAFEEAAVQQRLLNSLEAADFTSGQVDRLTRQLRRTLSPYLVVEVRREKMVQDALGQLWRRERCELLRPLKVRLGKDEGEEGVDHGGVQQEFFRIVTAEMMNPAYGMFATDSQSRISWFQARSPEPLYHFELLGLLMSLAVYNGVTLPVSFPLALYRKLLALPVTGLAHIRDGWPDLSRGLDSLLSWRDGDVADVFLRTYDFSVEAFGAIVSMAMDEEQALPRTSSTRKGKGKARVTDSPPPSSPTRMVTNENREQYVRDYVSWLTDRSIRAQYEAFARGFYVCLEKRSLSIFTPEALRRLVEGVPEIDMDALEETTRYEDGFGASHWLMQEFWKVVKAYPVHKQRDLLEFVTASDRVPVNGIRSVLFVIQRNGPDSERLPTSLTCFGRLLMPAYSSTSKLREKLDLALENAKGFGVP